MNNKIALITDTHAGARGDHLVIDEYFKRFYDTVFFPYLEENGIKTIIHLGDLFDRRKYTNHNILHRWRGFFFDKLRDYDCHFITGNHDVSFKSTNEVNSLDLFLQGYNINVYSGPQDASINGHTIGMLPWICRDNYEESMNFLQNTKSEVIMGHLEIEGFEMHKGQLSEGGMDKSIFKKFDLVCSGHYHTKSARDNIVYLGAPYEMTWADYNDPRGFHILDPDKKELEYIINPLHLFKQIEYDDSKPQDEVMQVPDCSNLYVKVIVKNKSNPYLFDLFMSKIEEMGPIHCQFIEARPSVASDFDIEDVEDTVSIIKRYCAEVETSDSNKLEKSMIALYNQALESI